MELRKIAGEDNPADLFTKHLESAAKLEQLIGLFNCCFMEGRAESAPSLKKATKDSAHIVDDQRARLWPSPEEQRDSKQDVAASAQMPHLKGQDRMDKEHPTVQPQTELYGEEEAPVTEELGDPVPRLSRGPRREHPGEGAPRQARPRDGVGNHPLVLASCGAAPAKMRAGGPGVRRSDAPAPGR